MPYGGSQAKFNRRASLRAFVEQSVLLLAGCRVVMHPVISENNVVKMQQFLKKCGFCAKIALTIGLIRGLIVSLSNDDTLY